MRIKALTSKISCGTDIWKNDNDNQWQFQQAYDLKHLLLVLTNAKLHIIPRLSGPPTGLLPTTSGEEW
jgi:hypothetical protein